MMIGIEKISFYTPGFYIDLRDLAHARNVNPDKFTIGLGQQKMSVPPPDEDIVTMAAAAVDSLNLEGTDDIDWLLFATESGIDQSKAAGIYVHNLLGLSPHCRVVELKQACYAATAGLQLALNYIQNHPKRKILLIASDIARYGLNTSGESSQGAGAVAILLSANPKILTFDPYWAAHTQDVMDFWRPNYTSEAFVDGKLSCKVYLDSLSNVMTDYFQKSGLSKTDLKTICYHSPIPKLVERAHVNMFGGDILCQKSLFYPRAVGNCYTASLYLAFLSLIENHAECLNNSKIGFYSYGSGAVAEFFSGNLLPDYQTYINPSYHQKMLQDREKLSINEYEAFYSFAIQHNSKIPTISKNPYRFSEFLEHKRLYSSLSHIRISKI